MMILRGYYMTIYMIQLGWKKIILLGDVDSVVPRVLGALVRWAAMITNMYHCWMGDQGSQRENCNRKNTHLSFFLFHQVGT